MCAEKGTGLKAMKKPRTLDSGVEAEPTTRLLVRVLGGRWCSYKSSQGRGTSYDLFQAQKDRSAYRAPRGETPGAMECMVLKITPRTDYLPRMLGRYSCLGSQFRVYLVGNSDAEVGKEPA